MIGKLIKHDLKDGARRMGNIYAAAGIAVVALLISAFVNSGILKFIASAAIIIVAFGSVIVTFASVVFGANKSLFGREGYLTHTLPVRTISLIFSKWFSSSIWVIISYIFVVISVVAVYVYWTVEDQGGAEIYDMIYSFAQSFGLGAEVIYKNYLIISAIIGLFNACIFVMFILFAITLSNISPFHKLGTFGVIIYLAATIAIIQGAANGLANLCDITLIIEQSGFSLTVDKSIVEMMTYADGVTIGLTSVYFKAIVTAFLFILTVQLTESKINLK